jgi:hypothetical protein
MTHHEQKNRLTIKDRQPLNQLQGLTNLKCPRASLHLNGATLSHSPSLLIRYMHVDDVLEIDDSEEERPDNLVESARTTSRTQINGPPAYMPRAMPILTLT